jgi:hypothetical protein
MLVRIADILYASFRRQLDLWARLNKDLRHRDISPELLVKWYDRYVSKKGGEVVDRGGTLVSELSVVHEFVVLTEQLKGIDCDSKAREAAEVAARMQTVADQCPALALMDTLESHGLKRLKDKMALLDAALHVDQAARNLDMHVERLDGVSARTFMP